MHRLSSQSIRNRKKNKTDFVDGRVTIGESVGRKRRRETFEAAEEIHGGTKRAASIGLIDTVLNRCSDRILTDVMCSSKRSKKVAAKVYKTDLKNYESSNENMCRSVSVYYSGGIMGKRKYRKLYRDSAFKINNRKLQTTRISIANCPVPRLVSYNKLMPFVKSIPIGTLHSIRDTLCEGMTDKVSGCYRSLKELLLCLAKFYLNKSSGYDLTWFNDQFTFQVALGGDGAPFGKDDTSCAWLVSLLNIGRGVLSSNENFLIFGANCPENALPVLRFINILLSDITTIQQETFSIKINNDNFVNVRFKIAELPNDMKMLAFLAGELNNSAKYFSSFADVSSNNQKSLTGTFGREENNLWKPWSYQHRLQVVQKVEAVKKSNATKTITEKTKRKKITELIGSLKSRQEFKPLLGELIDQAHVEPLHLKNNACALVHKTFLEEVILVSNIPNDHLSFFQLPQDNPLVKYVNTMKSKCSLSRLANKVVKHFDEAGPDAKKFDYRFTGKDSRLFLHNFMYLVNVIEPGLQDGTKSKFQFHVLAFLALTLRNCVSLFNRLSISDEQVSELTQLCKDFIKLNISFCPHFTPTVWTLGHVVPVHTKDMKGKYGMGLGLNSMEGRESKHVSISKYSVNTNYNSRWEQIFMHEYISLIWLRERGYNLTKPVSSSGLRYIPKRATSDDKFCGCGMDKLSTALLCKYCSHPFREKIKSMI